MAKKLGVQDPETLPKEALRKETYSTFKMLQSLETQQNIDFIKKKHDEILSSNQYPKTVEDYKVDACPPHDSKLYLKNMEENPYPFETDEHRDFENVRISHINNVRVNLMNLEPLPLHRTDGELETMLETDKKGGRLVIGKNCQEFLNQFTKEAEYLYNDYKQRMESIIALHNIKIDQAQKEQQDLYQFNLEFQKIMQVPEQTYVNEEGNRDVTPQYEKWLKDLKEFDRKLALKVGYYLSLKEPVPKDFEKMSDEIEKLIKKHFKEKPQHRIPTVKWMSDPPDFDEEI